MPKHTDVTYPDEPDRAVAYAVMMRDLPEALRPREQLAQRGPQALHLREIIAILLRTGNTHTPVTQLAENLLAKFKTLRGLANATIQELTEVSGIGTAKACQLQAAFELGKRLATLPDVQHPIVTTPQDAASLVMEYMRYYQEEHFLIIFLDTRHQLILQKDISVGTLNASLVHPREVFQPAIAAKAAKVILVHNHPSGDATPSAEDLALTARLMQVGELVGIPVLDHLVIGDNRFVSMKDRGMM